MQNDFLKSIFQSTAFLNGGGLVAVQSLIPLLGKHIFEYLYEFVSICGLFILGIVASYFSVFIYHLALGRVSFSLRQAANTLQLTLAMPFSGNIDADYEIRINKTMSNGLTNSEIFRRRRNYSYMIALISLILFLLGVGVGIWTLFRTGSVISHNPIQ